jgi:beta-glucosidase
VTVPAGSDAQVDFDIPAEQLQTVQQDGTSKIEKGDYVITISGAAPGKRTQELGVSSSAVNFKL